MRVTQVALPAVLAGGLVALALLDGEGTAQEVSRVEVVNLPAVQEVAGSVTVEDPVPHSKLVRFERVIVSPVGRSDTTNLVDAGRVDVSGFTHAVLSLRGESQGKLGRDGSVGAVLLPDEEAVERTFLEVGRFQFPLDVQAAALRDARGYFSSFSVRTPLAFPRYRVLLYNETDRSAEVDLYVYLTH